MRPVLFFVLCAILGLLMGCQNHPDSIREATAALKPVTDAYLQAWNTGNLRVLDTICVPNVVRYDRTTGVARGLDSLKAFIAGIRATYPDFKVTAVEELYLPNHAVVRWEITGTNTGSGGFTPTGRSFKATGLSLSDFVDGKLSVEHAEYDRSAVLLQLGVQLPLWTEGEEGKK